VRRPAFDLFGIRTAVWVVAALTAASGVLAAGCTYETHRGPSAPTGQGVPVPWWARGQLL